MLRCLKEYTLNELNPSGCFFLPWRPFGLVSFCTFLNQPQGRGRVCLLRFTWRAPRVAVDWGMRWRWSDLKQQPVSWHDDYGVPLRQVRFSYQLTGVVLTLCKQMRKMVLMSLIMFWIFWNVKTPHAKPYCGFVNNKTHQQGALSDV